MQALVTISNHPFKKITLACIACLCFISAINGSLATAFGSTAQATDNIDHFRMAAKLTYNYNFLLALAIEFYQ